ncbi:4802_t:CDS:2 [Diversispora eburnea]|uniref:V-type proton ATPase subunit G n=1 Tax=Diversispora eburnea TaxID=1213867 RepID=A0A9N9G033_9GLOM|nr:4802_t:CDS:2 [Diversispora eburnea]
MAAQSSHGIQTLLEAEKEASKIVSKARNFRVQRLKEARTEAAKEIEILKAQKKEEFELFEAEHKESSDLDKVKADTEAIIVTINEAFVENKSKVTDRLLSVVTNVQPTIHKNFKRS